MTKLLDSTQYDDIGTASVTWNAEYQLDAFAKHIGVPEEYIPIGLRIDRACSVNRNPTEDMTPRGSLDIVSVSVEVFALLRKELGGQSIPEYFRSQEMSSICIKCFPKDYDTIEDMLKWFKEIEIQLLTPHIAEMDISKAKIEKVHQ